MALSNNVTEAIADAESALRNALAYAARNERPYICHAIAELLKNCEQLHRTDELFDTLDNLKIDTDK